VAIADLNSAKIAIYKEGEAKPLKVLKNLHDNAVRFILHNHKYEFTISIDEKGFLEIWDSNYDFPERKLKFEMMCDTDYIQLMDHVPIAACLSQAGTMLAVITEDMTIRVFEMLTGKLIYIHEDEMIEKIEEARELS
jgi:WD40 repeat protein